MKRKKMFYYLLATFILAGLYTHAQSDLHQYSLQFRGLASTGSWAPFWMQSRDFGRVSANPWSSSLEARMYKPMLRSTSTFDWGYDLNVLAGIDSQLKNKVQIHALNVHMRWHFLQLMLGVNESASSYHYRPLSMGGFLLSHNAMPFPRITAGIPTFTSLPFTFGLIEIKGALTHGWFSDNLPVPGIMLHHKYLYLRVGGCLPVRFSIGLDHAAQWGGRFPNNSKSQWSLNNFMTIFMGNAGGVDASKFDQLNALGNHIISQHFHFETVIDDFYLQIYGETISEDGPIRIKQWQAMNRRDGLWGISLRNTNWPWVNGFLYEFLSTIDQSGPWHDKDGIVYGGLDHYFFNGQFPNGWTHHRRTIGTPLILSPVYHKDGNITIQMNDVQAHHFGLEGAMQSVSYRILGTYSRYFVDNQLPAHPNFSWMIELKKHMKQWHNTEWIVQLGGDTGVFPGKGVGIMFSVRKSGSLFEQ